jgi:hypothetical protein
LLLDIGLGVCAVRSMEFLADGILHFDRFDLLVQRGQGVTPKGVSVAGVKGYP